MGRVLLERADEIADDPRERMPAAMRAAFDDPRVRFDVHCHIFTFAAVPDGFLGIRIPLTRRLLGRLSHLLHRIIWYTDRDPLSNAAYFIEMGRTATSLEIAEKLLGYYTDAPTVVCPLLMDMRPGIKGRQKEDYRAQMEEARAVRDRLPGRVLPFVCLDPRSDRMEEYFLDALSPRYGFYGVKIYPSLGYLPSHPALMEVFRVCEAKGIPVTAHCGGASVHATARYLRGIEGRRRDDSGAWVPVHESRFFPTARSYARYFNDPRNWEPVLEACPRLRLNLAHFGSPGEWRRLAEGKNNTWPSRIMDLMRRYEGVYADFSNNIYDHRIHEILRRTIERNRLIAGRTLNGSDYYMVVLQGHFRCIRTDFSAAMGDDVMRRMAWENPRRFLLG